MKFLVIQTAFIGDVVLATPLIEKLRRFFPDADIDFLLRQGNEALLAGHPHVRRVWIWQKKQGKYKSLAGLLRGIRRERYDWVINCQRFAASGFLTAFSGARRAGFDKNPFAFLFDVRVAHRIGDGQHEVARNLALIRHLTDDAIEKPRLYPRTADFERAHALAEGRPYVCIAPTSVWFTKQFPAHKWVELIGRFPPDCRIFLLGGPADKAACAQIAASAGREEVYNLAGQLSFLESAALLRGARMNYMNDSAPLHFASAVDAPATAVFCSTLPAFGFTPLSTRSSVVEINFPLPCRPCGLHGKSACPEGHFRCAEGIEIAGFPLP